MYTGIDADPELVASARRLAEESSAIVVSAAAVTDTVKSVVGGFVADTLDRSGLVSVTLPIVVPAAWAGAIGDPGPDPAAWVVRARRDHPVVFVDVRD